LLLRKKTQFFSTASLIGDLSFKHSNDDDDDDDDDDDNNMIHGGRPRKRWQLVDSGTGQAT
jgi:hypothetical protein